MIPRHGGLHKDGTTKQALPTLTLILVTRVCLGSGSSGLQGLSWGESPIGWGNLGRLPGGSGQEVGKRKKGAESQKTVGVGKTGYTGGNRQVCSEGRSWRHQGADGQKDGRRGLVWGQTSCGRGGSHNHMKGSTKYTLPAFPFVTRPEESVPAAFQGPLLPLSPSPTSRALAKTTLLSTPSLGHYISPPPWVIHTIIQICCNFSHVFKTPCLDPHIPLKMPPIPLLPLLAKT